MAKTLLFTYGLLRKNAKHEMSSFLVDHAEHISEATFQGKLYLIEYYPGVIASVDKEDRVIGDVFNLTDPSILIQLDQFEGVGESFAQPNEYSREVRPVKLVGGEVVDAWVYLYGWSVKPENYITSGDFLLFREGRGRKVR